jgi:hypothetical protein
MREHTLPVLPAIGAIRICSPTQGQAEVTVDSSALLVMTDLKRVAAAVVSPQETVDAAHAFMFQRGVRMLLAVDADQNLAGIVTTNDILGEKPVAVANQRRMKHSDILVADVMTPASKTFAIPAGHMPRAAHAAPRSLSTCRVWSSKKKSGSNSRRNGPLSRPPRNIASSTWIFQAINVRIARSCAGALRAVTSAVRMRICALPACCSRCSAAAAA